MKPEKYETRLSGNQKRLIFETKTIDSTKNVKESNLRNVGSFETLLQKCSSIEYPPGS
jgi:hypothetical protein